MAQTLPKRSEIPVEQTWNPYTIYPSDEAWEAAVATLDHEAQALGRFQGHLGDSPGVLADYLQRAARLLNDVYKVYIHANMFHDADTTDQAAAARYDRANGLIARTLAANAFAEPEMLAMGLETLRRWAAEEPALAMYDHYFDALARRAAHVRPADIEELLGHLADPFHQTDTIHGTLADADMIFRPAEDSQGESHQVAQGTLLRLLLSPDSTLRRNAWKSYHDGHLAFKNTMAASLSAGVKQHNFLARARHYNSALEAALHPIFVPLEVFHSTIDAFRRHLPTWHRYWRLRRRALGVEKLHPADVRAPLAGRQPTIAFQQALDWVCQGLKPLGEEYVSAMRRGVRQQRWVDIYPNQNKRAGAYSNGVQGTQPFIMLNYANDILGLSVLAHELGHSMHTYYAGRTQPFIYSDYSPFVAEVASNFNQALVRAYLLQNNPDRDFQIAILEEAMANFHRYFFVMPILAMFELEIHERAARGEGLTADSLNTLMADLFRQGYGNEVEMDADRVGITWATFSAHMYLNFYVFQYATGLAGAHAAAADVLAGKPGAVEGYLSFLKSGSSLYPLDALKVAGVDLSTPEPMEKAFGVLAGMVERLEELLL